MSAKTNRLPGLLEIRDPGNAGAIMVPDHHHMSCALTTGGAETRTMGAPSFLGQMCTIAFQADGGDAVLTIATAVNQTGNNTLTFADAGDLIALVGGQSGANLRWRVVANDGVALSTV